MRQTLDPGGRGSARAPALISCVTQSLRASLLGYYTEYGNNIFPCGHTDVSVNKQMTSKGERDLRIDSDAAELCTLFLDFLLKFFKPLFVYLVLHVYGQFACMCAYVPHVGSALGGQRGRQIP